MDNLTAVQFFSKTKSELHCFRKGLEMMTDDPEDRGGQPGADLRN